MILAADVGVALRSAPVTAATWDVVVLDPPRTGVEAKALASLVAVAAPRLVYVSCDPATLARDARLLCEAGYTLTFAQPFDMFPQTHHVEVLAQFERGYGRFLLETVRYTRRLLAQHRESDL